MLVAEIILVPQNPQSMEAEKQCAQQVARALTGMGAKMREQVSLCSSSGEIQKAIAASLGRSNVVVVLGGLTAEQGYSARKIIAQGLRMPLRRDEALLQAIRDYCNRTGEPFRPEDVELAKVPEGARAFPGQYGKIPGMVISSPKQHIILLPDNQTEALAMLSQQIIPHITGSGAQTTVTRTVRTWGVKEQGVREKLGDLLGAASPAVTTERDGAEVLVRVSAQAPSKQEAMALCTPVLRKVVERLGDAAYGLDVDSLQTAVVQKLARKNLDLAVAESGSGGILTRVLSETPGGADVLRYSVVTDDNAAKQQKLGLPGKLLKKRGGVSEAVAVAMATAAREKAGTALGVAVTAETVSSEKDNQGQGPSVYIAVCDANNVYVKQLVVGKGKTPHRDVVVDAALSRALNMTRLFVDYLPGVYPGAIPLEDALAGKAITGRAGEDGQDGEEEARAPLYKRLLGNFIIRKADEGSVKVRKFIFILSVLVFLGSAGYVGMYYYESVVAARQQKQLVGMYNVDDDEDFEPADNYPNDYLTAFAKLWSENPDVVGYVRIDGTRVEYPVVQAEDNNYYLRRDFYGSSNQHGIPFMDYRADVRGPSDNLTIYGHNMKDGQMFGELIEYKDFAYYQEHPVIEFNSVYEANDYKIISVFITNAYTAQGWVFEYHNFVDAETEEDFMEFVNQVLIRSRINTGVDVQPGDKLLTLSTCTYEFEEARLVVVARQVRPGEDATVDVDAASVNPYPLYPDIWYNLFGGTKPNATQVSVVTQPTTNTSTSVEASTAASSSQSSSQSTASSQSSGGGSSAAASSSQSAQASSGGQDSQSASQSQSSQSSSQSQSAAESGTVEEASESSRTPEIDLASDTSRVEGGTLFDIFENDPRESENSSGFDYTGFIDIATAGGSQRRTSPVYLRSMTLSGMEPVYMEQDTGDEPSLFDFIDMDPPGGGSSGSAGRTGSGSSRAPAEYLTVKAGGQQITGDPVSIVARIVQVEVGGGFHEEAIKAQAVAAYSYVLFHNDRGQVPNVILSSESAVHSKVISCVSQVIGEAVYYGDNVAFTPYHATSAGKTTSSQAVWGGSYTYLVSVDSALDQNVSTFRMRRIYTSAQVSQILFDKLGIETWGHPGDWFEILNYIDDVYVGDVAVCGETKSLRTGNDINGRNLRENVLGLRSASFTIQYNEDTDQFWFTTSGYGHGVGMSQNGANQYAKEGWSYKQILEHYYPGTTVR